MFRMVLKMTKEEEEEEEELTPFYSHKSPE